MQTEGTAPLPALAIRNGVLVVDGHGVKVYVERRHLVVADGIGRHRREVRVPRASRQLRRLVILVADGFVTLAAVRLLADLKIPWLHISPDGRVLATSVMLGLDEPALRRLQAVAPEASAGLAVAQQLLGQKVRGQLRVLETLDRSGTSRLVVQAAEAIPTAPSMKDLLGLEARAASLYWVSWANLPVRFAAADRRWVPEHWLSVGARKSVITNSPRQATNPANAILNYLYALLEAECRIACLRVGLDPGMGVIHMDTRYRDSLALDIMEAVRPDVDAFVLKLLQERTLRARDFHETREGSCRILAPLTHELAEASPAWGRQAGAVAEMVAKVLVQASRRKLRAPTPYTQANRTGDHARSPRTPPASPGRSKLVEGAGPALCIRCRALMPPRGRKLCETCLPLYRVEQRARYVEAGREGLERARLASTDPAARARQAQRIREHRENQRRWEVDHERPDPSIYWAEILPRLASIPVTRIAKATGLSPGSASLIRKGERIPHPRHWDELRRLYRG